MTLDATLIDRITQLSPEKRVLLEQRMTSVIAHEAGPVPGEDVDTAPTSYAQRSQWFVNQLDPDNPFFNKTDAVRVRGPLDVESLRRAISALVSRHAVLRTGYRATDDGPVQVIKPPAAMDMPIVDIPPGPRQSVDLQRHLAAEQRRPFDLENGPMYRAYLVRLGPDDHVLVRTNHHIAFDRWSSAIANAELSALYGAFAAGDKPRLAPLPYQYTDYSSWQRLHLDESSITSHLEFAEAHLAGVPQILELPTDHPRPATQSHRGASYHTSLEPGLVRRIREAARAEGATPFMACLAGFGILVGRYARTDQFLVGVPAAGRNASGTDSLIGLFINSMVMRLDLRGDPSFSALVARVRAASLGAMSHQDLPFEVLVENLARDRAPGRTPVFQVMFDYINTPGARLTLGSLDLEPIAIADEASVYDINLYLYDDGTDIGAKWEYRSDLFDRPTIVRMSEAYTTLLSAAAADVTRPVSSLPLVSPEDRRRIRSLAEGPKTDVPASGTFLSMIEGQARERPDAAAVIAGNTVISFGDLWNLATGVSRRIESSCAPDARVAILTGRSEHLVPALLGVLHSGRTAVMVDTSQPTQRLSTMFDRVGPGAVVTGDGGSDLVPGVPDIEVAPVADAEPGPHPALASTAPAYVVFTSGSMGVPRAVAVGRPSVENFVEDAIDRYELGPGDRVLQFASPGFDTLVEEVLPGLAAGATLVMRPAELFASFTEFTTFVSDNDVTVLDLPTAWWHAWVDDMTLKGVESVPACVRLVVVGGEAASTDRWRAWRRITGGRTRLVVTYGPSETSVVVSSFEPGRDWIPATGLMPIGRPIRNTRLVVVDESGGELPPGVPGELIVEGIAVGYGNLDYMGMESDFEDTAAGPRYYTGDLVRMSVNGVVEYLGRINDQVKVNGMRIEPGENEAALMSRGR
jgi:amino acid adenylation domain-containing protein